MKLREINKKEFSDFCKNNPTNNFFQSKEWAELKRLDGWHTYFLGLDQNGKIRAVTLLLSREIPIIKKRIFYAPRGFIINFKDLELLRVFTKEIKKFIKEKKGIFLRIDPNFPLKQLDINGNYVQGGYNNEKCIDILRSLSYQQIDSNFTKPTTLYKLNLDGKNNEELLNNMNEETKTIILDNERKSIYIRDIDDNEINKVFDIINNSHNIQNYINNDVREFYRIFKSILDIKIVEIDIDKFIDNSINDNEKEKALELQYRCGHKVILGCSLSICYDNELTTVCSAINDKFIDLLPQYTLSWEIIKWAKKNSYETYSFYTIEGNLDDNNKIYQYYKGFNGYVVKLLGEFDLVINKFLYKRYYKYSKKHNLKITDFKKNK